MNVKDVPLGSVLSLDFLVGMVVRVEKNGLVPSVLISWEDGLERWMPLSDMQKFFVISPEEYKKAA